MPELCVWVRVCDMAYQKDKLGSPSTGSEDDGGHPHLGMAGIELPEIDFEVGESE